MAAPAQHPSVPDNFLQGGISCCLEGADPGGFLSGRLFMGVDSGEMTIKDIELTVSNNLPEMILSLVLRSIAGFAVFRSAVSPSTSAVAG